MNTRLTNKAGVVHELKDTDVKGMRPMSDVLPASLQRTIGQGAKQSAPTKGQAGSAASTKR